MLVDTAQSGKVSLRDRLTFRLLNLCFLGMSVYQPQQFRAYKSLQVALSKIGTKSPDEKCGNGRRSMCPNNSALAQGLVSRHAKLRAGRNIKTCPVNLVIELYIEPLSIIGIQTFQKGFILCTSHFLIFFSFSLHYAINVIQRTSLGSQQFLDNSSKTSCGTRGYLSFQRLSIFSSSRSKHFSSLTLTASAQLKNIHAMTLKDAKTENHDRHLPR
jgi:hypothetical protein